MFRIGEKVKITAGLFINHIGKIKEIDDDKYPYRVYSGTKYLGKFDENYLEKL